MNFYTKTFFKQENKYDPNSLEYSKKQMITYFMFTMILFGVISLLLTAYIFTVIGSGVYTDLNYVKDVSLKIVNNIDKLETNQIIQLSVIFLIPFISLMYLTWKKFFRKIEEIKFLSKSQLFSEYEIIKSNKDFKKVELKKKDRKLTIKDLVCKRARILEYLNRDILMLKVIDDMKTIIMIENNNVLEEDIFDIKDIDKRDGLISYLIDNEYNAGVKVVKLDKSSLLLREITTRSLNNYEIVNMIEKLKTIFKEELIFVRDYKKKLIKIRKMTKEEKRIMNMEKGFEIYADFKIIKEEKNKLTLKALDLNNNFDSYKIRRIKEKYKYEVITFNYIQEDTIVLYLYKKETLDKENILTFEKEQIEGILNQILDDLYLKNEINIEGISQNEIILKIDETNSSFRYEENKEQIEELRIEEIKPENSQNKFLIRVGKLINSTENSKIIKDNVNNIITIQR